MQFQCNCCHCPWSYLMVYIICIIYCLHTHEPKISFFSFSACKKVFLLSICCYCFFSFWFVFCHVYLGFCFCIGISNLWNWINGHAFSLITKMDICVSIYQSPVCLHDFISSCKTFCQKIKVHNKKGEHLFCRCCWVNLIFY